MKIPVHLALMMSCLSISVVLGDDDPCTGRGGGGPAGPGGSPAPPSLCRQLGGYCYDNRCENCTGIPKPKLCLGEHKVCCLPYTPPVNWAVCQIFSDPHIITYDGYFYDVQLPGWFNVSRPCDSDDFVVLARFAYPYSGSSWTKTVELKVLYKGIEIVVFEDGTVTVDGAATTLTYSFDDILVHQIGILIKIKLQDIEVEICFNTVTARIRIYVGLQWQDILCGICGNFNDDATDDDNDLPPNPPSGCPFPRGHQTWKDCKKDLMEIVQGECAVKSYLRFLIPCAYDACAGGVFGTNFTLSATRDACDGSGPAFAQGGMPPI